MWKYLAFWLWIESDQDDQQIRLLRTLYYLVSSLFILNLFFVAALFLITSASIPLLKTTLFFFIITFVSSILLRYKKINLAGYFLVTSLWILQVINTYPNGVYSKAFHSFFFVILLSGIFWGVKAMGIVVGVINLYVFGMFLLQENGILPPIVFPDANPLIQTIIQCSILTINSAISAFAIDYLNNERKRAGRKQEQFTAIINNPLVPIIIADKTGRVIEINSALEALFEMPGESILGKYIWDLTNAFLDPSMRSENLISTIKESIEKSLHTGKISEKRLELLKIITPSGRKLYIQQNQFIFQTTQGACLGALLVDFTEMENARKARQENYLAFRALFEQGPFETSVSRMDGELLDVNQRYCEVTGKPRSEIIGKTAFELGRINQTQITELRELVKKTNGIVDQYEMMMQTEPAGERTVLLSAKVIMMNDEPIVFTIITDISDRKRFEQKVVHQLKELNGLRKIDTSIISDDDIVTTLKLILAQAIELLHASTARIILTGQNGEPDQILSQGEELNTEELGRLFDRVERANNESKTIIITKNEFPNHPPAWQRFYYDHNICRHFLVPVVIRPDYICKFEVYFDSEIGQEDPDWIEYMETLAGQAALAITNHDLITNLRNKNEELLEAYESTISGWAHALEIRDEETFGHSERVLALSLKVAQSMRMSLDEISNFRRGVLLHDIGKIGIPDSILLKPGPLDEHEWEIMRQHPIFANKLLKGISFLKNALDVPYCHHERWDGSGYPCGLKGEEIPLSARIFAVVDVWDALTNERPYRKAWTEAETRDYILQNSGIQFDPHVINAFMEILDQKKGS
jgi:PAS domain S-box-containing protein